MADKAKQKGKATAPERPAPNDRERSAMERAAKRVSDRRQRVAISLRPGNDGRCRTDAPHNDVMGHVAQLLDVCGTSSGSFAEQAIGRLMAIARQRGAELPTPTEANAALAFMDGLEPENEVEAALAVQMYATHETAMEMLTRAKMADNAGALQNCGNLAVKLLRTYTAQAEALAKLRRGGEQTVRVLHVDQRQQTIIGEQHNHADGAAGTRARDGDVVAAAVTCDPAQTIDLTPTGSPDSVITR